MKFSQEHIQILNVPESMRIGSNDQHFIHKNCSGGKVWRCTTVPIYNLTVECYNCKFCLHFPSNYYNWIFVRPWLGYYDSIFYFNGQIARIISSEKHKRSCKKSRHAETLTLYVERKNPKHFFEICHLRIVSTANHKKVLLQDDYQAFAIDHGIPVDLSGDDKIVALINAFVLGLTSEVFDNENSIIIKPL